MAGQGPEYENAAFLALAILMPATAKVAGMPRFIWVAAFNVVCRSSSVEAISEFSSAYFALSGGMAASTTLFWFLGKRPFV